MTSYIGIALWGQCLTTFSPNTEWEFPNYLNALGLCVVPLGDPRATHFVAMDHSARALKLASKHVPRNNRMLFVFEPEAVNPSQHKTSTRAKYSVVVIGSERHRRSPKERIITLGSLPRREKFEAALEHTSSRVPGSVGILNENKFSFTRRNLYKYRWEAIRSLSRNAITVDVGGRNWDRGWCWHLKQQLITLAVTVLNKCSIDLRHFHGPLPRNPNIRLHGRVESELDFLASFDFCLVIENDPDYISEKLFNAIMAGTVPLYVGPPLEEFEIPSTIAVQVNKGPEAFSAVLDLLTESQKDEIRSAGRSWLEEPGLFEKWSHATALRTMAVEIAEFLRGH